MCVSVDFSCNYKNTIVLKVVLADDLPKEPLRQRRKCEKPRAETENRKVSRCVALIAFLLLAVCFALMGVSFTLTSKIDEMGESLTHRTLGLMSLRVCHMGIFGSSTTTTTTTPF